MNLLLLQLADSAFPTGSFTHSGGLEAAYQHGEVRDIGELRAFGRAALWQAGYAALPLVNAAHIDPERLRELDTLSEAFLRNPVTNRASRSQGRAFVSTCARAFPSPAIGEIERRVRGDLLIPHLAPVFGAILSALNIDCRDAGRLYLYLVIRGVLSAAVRLGIVGSIHAQRLQAESRDDIERVLGRCCTLGDTELAQPSPLLDLFQGTHDRLYSRLFHS